MRMFIYVFDENAKERLLNAGYVLVKETDNKQYIFYGDNIHNFSIDDSEYVVSDTLTF